MYHIMFFIFAFVSLLGISPVYAHDVSLHKGKPTVGKVVSTEDNGFTLKTDTGTTPVIFQDKTTFERGDAHASLQDIKTGDQVTVFGTKLPTGTLVAREVLLPTANAKRNAAHPDHHAE